MTATVLVVAEHDNAAPRASFYSAVTAARRLGDEVVALVLGANCGEAAQAAANCEGVSRALLAQGAHLANGLAENCAPVIAEQARATGAARVVMAAGTLSREWLPRAAALADSQMLTDVIDMPEANVYVRPMYAGNVLATVESADALQFLSARTTAFAPAAETGGGGKVEEVSGGEDSGLTEFVEERVSKSERPELTSAKIVVSGGRGVGSAENFQLIEKLADSLGAAVGASRAAVDAGYVPNDYQVGQTGKIVAPDLYLAVGISGAIQHIAGMKDSKCIVAINKDADAPIFEIADYGLVADLFEAVPQLQAAAEAGDGDAG